MDKLSKMSFNFLSLQIFRSMRTVSFDDFSILFMS